MLNKKEKERLNIYLQGNKLYRIIGNQDDQEAHPLDGHAEQEPHHSGSAEDVTLNIVVNQFAEINLKK